MSRRIAIAIPAFNEATTLARTVEVLRAFVDRELPADDVTVIIADNASTDDTAEIGRGLGARMVGVRYLRLEERGKGLAIRRAWESTDADVYAFMDADLATELEAFPSLAQRISDGAGMAVGSRFLPQSNVQRSLMRSLFSWGYRALLKIVFATSVADAPCGFKAVSPAVRQMVSDVQSESWFFDSELLIRAEQNGHRIVEVPITWRDRSASVGRSKVRVWRVVREYLHEVLRLRRALHIAAVAANPEEYREQRIVRAAIIALTIVTSIAPIVAMVIAAAQGIEWNGRQSFAPGDLSAYLSAVSQTMHGSVFLQNMATPEATVPVLKPLWSLVGWAGWLLWLSPLAAFLLARIVLVPVGAFALYRALRYFVRDRAARIAGFIVLLFGSGIGMYVATFLPAPPVTLAATYQWPTDIWVAESNVFASFGYSPHFIASWVLQIGALFLLARAWDRGRMRDALSAGGAAFLLLAFHPFYAPTLYAVALVWLAWRALRRRLAKKDIAFGAVFFAATLPAIAYYAWLVFGTANGTFMHDSNQLMTPSLQYVLAGLGGFILLAPIGYLLARRVRTQEPTDTFADHHHRTELLALWAITNFALIYAPISFQRRLMEGLLFPLAALSGYAIASVVQKYKDAQTGPRFFGWLTALVGLILLFVPSTFLVVARDVRAYNNADQLFFFSADESALLKWIRTETPRDALVLSSVGLGNDVLGWGERRVYAGHWAETIALSQKNAEIRAFFSDMSSDARAAFVQTQGIDFVIEGPDERKLGGVSLAKDQAFVAVFGRGGYSVFVLAP